ncbi:hypothetical protein [Pseudomonas sp. Hg5Tf]|uniref:DUF104 domain-containing protein n=1 Tax=Pseudomonas sp. Hg7Tf TaxID=3236988 RepID=A0AB39HR41_9PSED|nr:hypothetical protein [Pseudomonas sp. Hg5Tf]MDH2559001.1 hypothetical protein [Pseudomonas sp. Hg5Tf]
MPKQYEVLELSYINGQLYKPGSTVTLEIDNPGSNLKLVSAREDGDDEKASLIAELLTYGVELNKNTGLEKLRAKLAEVKGE